MMVMEIWMCSLVADCATTISTIATKRDLLQNNNGVFRDITKTISPELEFAGMIEAALFTDFNNDKNLI